MRTFSKALGFVLLVVVALPLMAEQGTKTAANPLVYINTVFENASPLFWEMGDQGEVNVFLMYDHERDSPNRAAGHWHFRVEAPKGSEVPIILNNLDNIYNGRKGSPAKDSSISYVSPDGKTWRAIETELLEGNRLKLLVKMEAAQMYVARLEPYRLSDLENLLDEIRDSPHVDIRKIGETVEGRPLEIIQVGNRDALHRVLIRARAHPWEPGGSWVVQGMIRRLLRDDEAARACRKRYSVCIMPMANKDGVVRGWTRFNVAGKDLNRNWDQPADAVHAPENRALESWIESMIAQGRKPDVMIDFHNDQNGRLHISRPDVDLGQHLALMKRVEALLRKHTWFTEGATGGKFRNPGSIGEGLLERYGMQAFVHELHANRIAGLDSYPSGANWELYGEQLCEVLYELFPAD